MRVVTLMAVLLLVACETGADQERKAVSVEKLSPECSLQSNLLVTQNSALADVANGYLQYLNLGPIWACEITLASPPYETCRATVDGNRVTERFEYYVASDGSRQIWTFVNGSYTNYTYVAPGPLVNGTSWVWAYNIYGHLYQCHGNCPSGQQWYTCD